MDHPVVPEQAPLLPYDQTLDAFLTTHAERPALGERVYTLEPHPQSGETTRCYQPQYRTFSYQTLRDRVRALALAWRVDQTHAVPPGAFVGMIGFASVDYAVLDLAAAYAKAIPVPLSRHYSTEEYEEIFQGTQPVALAVSINFLPAFVALATKLPSLRSLIVFDYDEQISAERQIYEEAQRVLEEKHSPLALITLQDLITRGASTPFEFLSPDLQSPEDTALLIHTSGSTGKPKGACIPAKALLNTWRTVSDREPNITVILAPFHHMMGRDNMYSTLNAGGTAYFTLRADLSTLFEDIRLSRPTVLFLFPRICDMIYQHFQGVRSTDANGDPAPSTFLGDRLQDLFVSSAPLLPKIKDFMARTFQVPVHHGYSSTETASGGLAMDGHLNRHNVLAYRLRDVPEHGYFTTDQPYPRGELCVKTRFGIRGYFNNPEATAALFDEDGYSCTGDIVEERGPNEVAIIDRRANVLKLTQGEYVAVGKLGVLFEQQSSLIHQCYVYGESHRSYLLAVVVPHEEAIRQLEYPPTDEAELKSRLRSEILRLAQENKLRNFEIPRDLIIADEPFSQKNGLLSSVSKYLRPAIKARYGPELDALYDAHELSRQKELETLHQKTASEDIEGKLASLFSATLGIPWSQEEQAKTFQEMGGDSLAAVQLSILIDKELGATITGDQILGPQGHPRELARLIHENPSSSLQALRFVDIHGENPSELFANDLKLEAFLGSDVLTNARSLSQSVVPPSAVLLTGATGFLGGRLCLSWLDQLAETNGKLVCLVRPSASQSAQERLKQRFTRLDQETAAHYRALFEEHVDVISGDISLPSWGLDAGEYERLANEVDSICHAAALVNHLLSYEHLFRPNVVGTVEAIRFALTGKKKPLHFVSTLGVEPFLKPTTDETEAAPLVTSLALDESYARGYFASKWASEHLLRLAHEQADLPIRILRPGLILPDRQLPGEINRDDILSRLITSLLATGLAPASFPSFQEGGFQIDGLPVDQLADSIVTLTQNPDPNWGIYHAFQGPKDNLSLDALVSWIESAGHPLCRVPDYQDWINQMKQALSTLPRKPEDRYMTEVMEAYQTEANGASTPGKNRQFLELLAATYPHKSTAFFTEAYLQHYLKSLAS